MSNALHLLSLYGSSGGVLGVLLISLSLVGVWHKVLQANVSPLIDAGDLLPPA